MMNWTELNWNPVLELQFANSSWRQFSDFQCKQFVGIHMFRTVLCASCAVNWAPDRDTMHDNFPAIFPHCQFSASVESDLRVEGRWTSGSQSAQHVPVCERPDASSPVSVQKEALDWNSHATRLVWRAAVGWCTGGDTAWLARPLSGFRLRRPRYRSVFMSC